MPANGVVWVDRSKLDRAEIETAITEFESTTGTHLHWVARHHLVEGSGQADDPFPRVEEHTGYLFGIIYVPSNPDDTYAEFDELVFTATHDRVIGTYSRGSRSSIDWPELFDNLSSTRVFGDSDAEGGRVLVRMLKTVVRQLTHDAENFTTMVNDLAREFGLSLEHRDPDSAVDDIRDMSRRERRLMLGRVEVIRDLLASQRKEVPLMTRVVTETEGILERLATDQLDLSTDSSGGTRQLFTRELEIFISDMYVDARHVSSLMADIEYRLSMIRDYLKQLKDDENVSANRFTGAIASIMLLPTFIVGLYGQNFGGADVGIPELEWRFGYLYSWGLIAAVTVGQIWFFKRRRWL
ncbi:MAG: magnesium transporter CorA family protein [Actinomycetota bacterium]